MKFPAWAWLACFLLALLLAIGFALAAGVNVRVFNFDWKKTRLIERPRVLRPSADDDENVDDAGGKNRPRFIFPRIHDFKPFHFWGNNGEEKTADPATETNAE